MAAQSTPKFSAKQIELPDLATLSTSSREAMHDGAALVLKAEQALSRSGRNVITEVLRDADSFDVWARYPAGDVFDPVTDCHFFYHAHAADEMMDGENGHFHLFIRPHRLAPGLKPWALAGARVPEDEAARFIHVCAISVDNHGRAIRIFTTNRWVTDETLYRSEDIIALLDHFEVGVAHPNLAVSDWVTGMVALYRPAIEELLRQRDHVLDDAAQNRNGDDALFEDRQLQNISEMLTGSTVELVSQIEASLGLSDNL